MWGTNTGFTSFAYTPQGYPLHQITAAAADAALPLTADRLKQADRIQAVYIPIPAINAPIQAEKRREYRQGRCQEGSAADRQQTEGKPETLPNIKTVCSGCFYAVRLTDAARILDADRSTINRQRMQKQTEARQRIAVEYPMPNNCLADRARFVVSVTAARLLFPLPVCIYN